MSSNPASAGKRIVATELDRVAYAVEGAESSHGTNAAMWRAEPAGPQGPMQVSEKAAIDGGGGNRFDVPQNRTLGRAYIELLHKRYGNWRDAISAYNWGPGRVDGSIKQGRPAARLMLPVTSAGFSGTADFPRLASPPKSVRRRDDQAIYRRYVPTRAPTERRAAAKPCE